MQNNERVLTVAKAINEATEQIMKIDPSVYIIAEGAYEPNGMFGTAKDLHKKFGHERVFDMPVAENGLTGVALGSALVGMKPLMIHMRVDFTLYAMDQIVNNLAKWWSMFGGKSRPAQMVIRMIIGQGWGQGNQHSQNLQGLYAHIPGLKVVLPSNAYDAKGLLISAIKDPNPVLFLEHRWIHNTTSVVPEEIYEVPIGKCKVLKEGKDITIVSWSYMVVETLNAVRYLEKQGVSVEVVDVRSLRPFDFETIKKSLLKTKNLLVVDGSWKHNGFAGEVLARVFEDEEIHLQNKPKRIAHPDHASPSSPGLSKYYFPTMSHIYRAVSEILGKDLPTKEVFAYEETRSHDQPDSNFKGPF